MKWYQLNHWCQWFFNGFSESQPLVTMVFDGCQPLVQQCDGNDTSFQSTHVACGDEEEDKLLKEDTALSLGETEENDIDEEYNNEE